MPGDLHVFVDATILYSDVGAILGRALSDGFRQLDQYGLPKEVRDGLPEGTYVQGSISGNRAVMFFGGEGLWLVGMQTPEDPDGQERRYGELIQGAVGLDPASAGRCDKDLPRHAELIRHWMNGKFS